MCTNESHVSLLQPEHFTRHAMKANQLRAMAQSGLREVSVDTVVLEANEALNLKDEGVSKECLQMLGRLAQGDLLHAVAS